MFKHDVPVATSHTVCDMDTHDAISFIEDHALATTLDPPSEPLYTWSDSFIDPTARPTNIDDLERALMSFSLTPQEHMDGLTYSKLYDISNSSSRRTPFHPTTPTVDHHNGIKLQFNLAKAYCDRDDRFATDMHEWRNMHDVHTCRQRCRKVMPSYSVAVLSAGGCICTIGSIRSGFTPIWGTETDPDKQVMWEDLTTTPCLGDTFQVDFSQQRTPVYMSSGQNCEAYSGSGPRSKNLPAGEHHKTGWMFVAQTSKILISQPHSIKLEMSEGANHTNGGAEIEKVMNALSPMYYLFLCRSLPTWKYGDGSNRKRLFIIGFHRKKCGERASHFRFPAAVCTAGYHPIAADYAVPDQLVPQDYWVREPPGEVQRLPWRDPAVGELHKIGFVVSNSEMGPPQRPYALYSWLGIWNTQVTTNGGGRRPPLTCKYEAHTPITWTRMTVPLESVRVQGLPDDYLTWFRSLPGCRDDNMLRSCVNSGIPLCTSVSIDSAVHAMLLECGVPFDITPDTMPSEHAFLARDKIEAIDKFCQTRLPSWLGPEYKIRRITLDTGATNTFLYTDVEPFMINSRPSNATIGTATKGAPRMRTSRQGALPCLVYNMAGYDNVAPVTPFMMPHTTSVPELSKELLSPDEFFRYGKFNILLRQPDYEGGVSELYREAKPGVPEARIPLLYDWIGSGGWHMFYMPSRGMSKADERALARHIGNVLQYQDKGTVERWRDTHMNDEQAQAMHAFLVEHECVQEFKVSPHLRGEDDPIAGSSDEAEGSRGLNPTEQPPPKPTLNHPSLHTPTTNATDTGTTNNYLSDPSSQGSEVCTPCKGTPRLSGVPWLPHGDRFIEVIQDDPDPDPTLTQNTRHQSDVQCEPCQTRPLPRVRGDHPTIPEIPNPKALPTGNLMHHPCMAEIRGATARISKRGINRMSFVDKHNHFCHMGSNPKCPICKMAGGAMRKIYKKVDPYKEIRPGYLWTMDILTPDVQSLEGSLYEIVLMDVASETLEGIPIHSRDQVYDAIEEFISDLRGNPIYDDLPYPIVSVISTDNAGEWGYENAKWQTMAKRVRVRMRYGCPDRKEEVARGERAVGLFEVLLKATLMERNLPPSWWERASLDVIFCWGYFAKINYHPAVPIDGDRPRPREILTRGFVSRVLCDKRLGEYVPVGSPALVHDIHVKGSHIGPKTRWCVATGMFDDQPIWWDPIINSKSRSKSYVSYTLGPGMNYTHFLRLPPLPSTRRRCATEIDCVSPDLILHLPDCIAPGQLRTAPEMIETKQPKSDDPRLPIIHPTLRDDHIPLPQGRSTIGPELIDSEGRHYRVDKTTGVLRPVAAPPTPTPTIIHGDAERRSISDIVKGETFEDDIRDACEISSEYQDIAYSEVLPKAAKKAADKTEEHEEMVCTLESLWEHRVGWRNHPAEIKPVRNRVGVEEPPS